MDIREGRVRIAHDGILGDTFDVNKDYEVFFGTKDSAMRDMINSEELITILYKEPSGNITEIPIGELSILIKCSKDK